MSWALVTRRDFQFDVALLKTVSSLQSGISLPDYSKNLNYVKPKYNEEQENSKSKNILTLLMTFVGPSPDFSPLCTVQLKLISIPIHFPVHM